MRIIGGEARGRRLFAPDGDETRPTSDRTRESLFNILARRVPGARVLDLFGGSGALALEALSRGARDVVIVDASPAAMRVIERNALLVAGKNTRVRTLRMDYKKAISALPDEPFDLIFLDPPYRLTEVYADAVTRLHARGLIGRDALIVMERASSACVRLPEGFVLADERTYRDTVMMFVSRGDES